MFSRVQCRDHQTFTTTETILFPTMAQIGGPFQLAVPGSLSADRPTGRSQTKCCDGRDLLDTPPSATSAAAAATIACKNSGPECQGSSPAAPRQMCCGGDGRAACICCFFPLTGRVCSKRSLCTPRQSERLLRYTVEEHLTSPEINRKRHSRTLCGATIMAATGYRLTSFATGCLLVAELKTCL